jgi:hypothetical protein
MAGRKNSAVRRQSCSNLSARNTGSMNPKSLLGGKAGMMRLFKACYNY